MLDPDQQVQQALRLFFATFERTGSVWAMVQAFRREGWKFPKHGQAGSGEIVWLDMTQTVALETLHNPRYAGAFCFGRTRTWKDAAGPKPHGPKFFAIVAGSLLYNLQSTILLRIWNFWQYR